MTNEFMREERYIVFKMSDLGNSLKGDEIRQLAQEYEEHRQRLGKKPLECVVVEKDWPEYEPTWKAIEARVTGAQQAPTIAEQDQINAEAVIRSIYDARLSDEALWQTIGNGMITPAHIAQAVVEGTITPAYIMHPASSVPEGVSFMDTSQLEGVVSAEIVHSYPPPSGWLRAIDEALIVAHIGMANADDTYAQAKSKLDTLIGLHADIATDPAVNGGWKLVPTAESRHPGIYKMLGALHAIDNTRGASEWESYAAMLAAAPEAKP